MKLSWGDCHKWVNSLQLKTIHVFNLSVADATIFRKNEVNTITPRVVGTLTVNHKKQAFYSMKISTTCATPVSAVNRKCQYIVLFPQINSVCRWLRSQSGVCQIFSNWNAKTTFDSMKFMIYQQYWLSHCLLWLFNYYANSCRFATLS